MAKVAKRWQIAPTASDSHLNLFSHLPRPLAQILFNRGLTDPEKAERFLANTPRDHNPFLMKGMHQAVTRLRQAIREDETIAIYGDFDADGVTSTALLVETLRALGASAQPYIPHRVDEGYGLHTDAIDELTDQKIKLILTVDCGIRAIQEVQHAAEQGIDIIITDHHSPGTQPPPAVAILNPKQPDCPYPFKDLAGVGVAFKLAQALLRTHKQVPITAAPVNLVAEDLLDIVALGTVADMVSLIEENRSLVTRGLAKINQGQRPGLIALVQRSGLQLGQVSTSDISFGLGPRINAAGRLSHANTAYQLLLAKYPGEADKLADELNELNQRRRHVTTEAQTLAREQALADDPETPLLFAASPDFLEGVVGLTAGRLCEEFYRPAVVVSVGDTFSRGSARSITEFHITEALDQCEELLLRHGGHAAAAGFTVENQNLPLLAHKLKALAAEKLCDQALQPILSIDTEVGLGELDRQFYDSLAQLEPFGYANPEPTLITRRLRVVDSRAVGTNGAHLKLYLSDGRVKYNAIAFRQGYWIDHLPGYIDVAYHFDLNRWNGREQLQLNVIDLRPAQ